MLCRVRWTLPDLKHLEDTEAIVKALQSKGKASRLDLPAGMVPVCNPV